MCAPDDTKCKRDMMHRLYDTSDASHAYNLTWMHGKNNRRGTLRPPVVQVFSRWVVYNGSFAL
jgi:hypothetical protein